LAVPLAGDVALDIGPGRLTAAPVLLAATAFAGLLAAWSARRSGASAIWRSVRVVALPLAAFVAVSSLSAMFAPDLARAGMEIARWVEMLLAVLVAAALTRATGKASLAIAALLAAGAAEAVLGIRTALLGGGPASFVILGSGAARAYGSFGQPNPFAGYLNMVWPLGAALLLCGLLEPGSSRLLRAGALVSVGFCGVGLVLSYSRGAWLGAAAGAAAMATAWLVAALSPQLRRRGLPLVWAGVAAALALMIGGPAARAPAALVERAASAMNQGFPADVRDAEVHDANYATVERVAHWQAALAMWAARPWLGQGPGQFEVAYGAYRLPRWPEPLGHPHNVYLQALAEGGLIGLCAFLAVLSGTLFLGLRAALRPAAARQRPLGLAVVGVLVAVSVHGLADNLFVHDMTIQLGVLLGLAAAAGTVDR
jgi:O-antigen ligase